MAFSEWNSSPVVKETTKRGKKKKLLTPATFSIIHATDFADRTERYIIPLLKAGAVVSAIAIPTRRLPVTSAAAWTRLDPRALPLCRAADAGLLFSRAARNGHETHSGRPQRYQVLRGRHGSGTERRSRREFPSFPAAFSGVRKNGAGSRLYVIDATCRSKSSNKQMRQLVLSKLIQAQPI